VFVFKTGLLSEFDIFFESHCSCNCEFEFEFKFLILLLLLVLLLLLMLLFFPRVSVLKLSLELVACVGTFE